MTSVRRGLVALLCLMLCLGAGRAGADETEYEARWERLLSFATEEYADWWQEDSACLHLSAQEYEEEKGAMPWDFSALEELSLVGFDQAQFEEILAQIPHLRDLSLWSDTVEDFTPLLALPSLEVLELGTWDGAVPGRLTALKGLPGLTELVLYTVPAAADLSPLAGMEGLVKLHLYFEEEAVCDLQILAEMPALRSLSLYCPEGMDESLPDLPALEELSVYPKNNLDLLIHTPALRVLEIYNIPEGLNLAPLAELARLEELELGEPQSDGQRSPAVTLPELPGLRALRMHYVPADTDMAALEGLTGLEELEIRFENTEGLRQYSLPTLPELTRLRRLTIDSSAGGIGAVIEDLPVLPSLEEFCTYADMEPALLRHTPALRVLIFEGGEDITALGELQALEELYLGETLPEDFSPLRGLPELRYLQINANETEPADYVEPLEALHESRPELEIVLFHCC